jgi:hypothetical protein
MLLRTVLRQGSAATQFCELWPAFPLAVPQVAAAYKQVYPHVSSELRWQYIECRPEPAVHACRGITALVHHKLDES